MVVDPAARGQNQSIQRLDDELGVGARGLDGLAAVERALKAKMLPVRAPYHSKLAIKAQYAAVFALDPVAVRPIGKPRLDAIALVLHALHGKRVHELSAEEGNVRSDATGLLLRVAVVRSVGAVTGVELQPGVETAGSEENRYRIGELVFAAAGERQVPIAVVFSAECACREAVGVQILYGENDIAAVGVRVTGRISAPPRIVGSVLTEAALEQSGLGCKFRID
jgi:hypothetical protein